MSVTATLRIQVSNAREEEALHLLRGMIEPTRAEMGCKSCRLYRELGEPTSITWIEEWATQEDLTRHLRSPQYRRILVALDMADVEPEVRFDTVEKTAGMQLIAEARGVPSQD